MNQKETETTTETEVKAETTTVDETTTEKTEVPKTGATNFYKEQATQYKEKLETFEQEKTELEQRLKEFETRQLQEKENWQELYKREKVAREKAEQNTTSMKTKINTFLKGSAIKEHAIKSGIKDNYMDFLDINSPIVEIESTSTGNVNVLGAQEYIDDFKARYPEAFGVGTAPTVNTSTGVNTKVKQLTAAEIAQLQQTDPERYKAEIKKFQQRRK